MNDGGAGRSGASTSMTCSTGDLCLEGALITAAAVPKPPTPPRERATSSGTESAASCVGRKSP
jgi:hypothetical protein